MVRLFVRHPVNDFSAWKKVYDEFDEERKNMGVRGDAVYQSVSDPNDVTVWHDFDSLEAAKSFTESDRLEEVMAKAGVAGDPTLWYTNPA
ncbi:MAG: cyclase, partial [Thermoanaerobaculia bacterium]|nr:cyclase [Thermoanaerobaculia bacterium]